MHYSVHIWVQENVTRDEIAGKRVIEAGALDVNGSVRPFIESFQPESYLGTDMRDGPGVDQVSDAANIPDLGTFDVVISTEMLEHAEDWHAAVAGLLNALEPEGLLVLTTRSKGFAYHDHPGDFWRYSVPNMRLIMERAGMEILALESDPEAPGVFVKARKPEGWIFPENPWADINLDPPC